MIDDTKMVPQWDSPAFWHGAREADAPVSDRPRRRSGILSRFVAALLAAETRFREAERMERMCNRMRSDIGLPLKGDEARHLQRRIAELQRWS